MRGSDGRGRAAPAGAGPRYVLDRFVFRLRAAGREPVGGELLLGGEPPRLLRLSSSGRAVLEQLLSGGAPSADGARLADRLAAAGLLHPSPRAAGRACSPTARAGSLTAPPRRLAEVAVVLPARDPPPSFRELVASVAMAHPGAVIVVDDGSADRGAASAAAARAAGARLVRTSGQRGPAAARNAGRGAAPSTAGLLLFLDADTTLERRDPLGWLAPCLEVVGGGRVAMVAPRVVSGRTSGPRGGRRPRPGPIDAYEARESPLDLGPEPGLVGARRRLSYVPAAALLARREALDEIGGFDESLRYGEDVDLVRRLELAGWLVRYEPSAVVAHAARSDLGAFFRQRWRYGASAAALERRHPGTVAPFSLRWPPRPLRLRRLLARFACAAPGRQAARLSLVLGARWATGTYRGLLAAVRRAWWPLLLPALCSRRCRGPALWLAALASGAGHGPAAVRSGLGDRSFVGGIEHMLLGLVDDAGYCCGLWAGCAAARSPRALLPDLGPRRTGRAPERLRARPRVPRARPGPPSSACRSR